MINLIYARDVKGGIGLNNQLPWGTQSLKEDLDMFKAITMGHNVVMGSKTYESLPASVRPLPGRQNIVFSKRMDQSTTNPVVLRELYQLSQTEDEIHWVIGGAQILKLMMPYATYIQETVLLDYYRADTFMEELPSCFSMVKGYAYESASGVSVRTMTYRNAYHARDRAFETDLTDRIERALQPVRPSQTAEPQTAS